jgi:dimethylamine corrinoid protein
MSQVGKRFEEGEYFLSELILGAEIFKEVNGLLTPLLGSEDTGDPLATVVLATPESDIHDLGKNIFAALLRGNGFRVHDLGVDVSPAVVVDAVKEREPEFVGFSCLLTNAFEPLKATIDGLGDVALRDGLKVLIGGGVTTPDLAEYVGADFQTTDAAAGVSYCLQQIGKGG